MEALEAEIASFEDGSASELSAAAERYKEKGIVEEQWEPAGSKIEYVKSKLERGGWKAPGQANADDEEEDNVDQDDLNVAPASEEGKDPGEPGSGSPEKPDKPAEKSPEKSP